MFVFFSFLAIAAMRVIQKICSKNASYLIEGGVSFFRYSTIYQFIAAIFSAFAFIGYGISGFNMPTVICSFLMAILFSLDLYTGIEAVKGASLIVVTMYSLGGLIISCIVSWIAFGEAMSIPQMIGLVIFFLSVYLLTPSSKENKKKITLRTYIMLISSVFIGGITMIVQKYFSLKVVDGNTAMFSFLTFFLNAVIMGICWLIWSLKSRKNAEACSINSSGAIGEEVNCDAIKNKQEIVLTTSDSELKKSNKNFLGMPLILYLYATLLAFALFLINLLITELGKTVSSVILFPISSAITILITTIVGWLVYKEKLSIKNIIGVVLGLLSIVIIGVFTPEVVANLFTKQ